MSGIRKATIAIDERLIAAINGAQGDGAPPTRSLARRELHRRLSIHRPRQH
jgi:hypothetical protein